ncbi:MAG: hypothetical protein ACE5FD_17580, partial [Anaerolineae bacterium]
AFREWWLGVRAALERERQVQVEQEQTQQRQLAPGLHQQAEYTAAHQLSDEPTAVPDKQQQMAADIDEVNTANELANANELTDALAKSQQQGWGLG